MTEIIIVDCPIHGRVLQLIANFRTVIVPDIVEIVRSLSRCRRLVELASDGNADRMVRASVAVYESTK